MKRHHISFKHAFDGIYHNLSTQPNFRVHLVFALIASLLGYYLHISPTEWIILSFTITLVIVVEMLNTALEAIVDLLISEYHKSAKIAKDTSAGMVLVTAFAAIIVGLIIFLPKLLNLI